MKETWECLSSAAIDAIEVECTKYPSDRRKSAIIKALFIAQEENGGWLSQDLINEVADVLGIPRIAAFEVATFYSMFDLNPVGSNKIYVCTSISCMLRGSDEILQHIKNRLNIDVNETTPDGKFTLKTAECLASCGTAPMMQINKDYHENLDQEKIDKILLELSE